MFQYDGGAPIKNYEYQQSDAQIDKGFFGNIVVEGLHISKIRQKSPRKEECFNKIENDYFIIRKYFDVEKVKSASCCILAA
tara:strand:+ start:54 stop:296 length:243 start_codon:yes stop_codon:yes gene_type:complete